MNKNEYLQRVLESYRMSHVGDLLNKYRKKRQEIKEVIEAKYTGDIYSPLNSGSYAKHTAINSKFDLDLMVPFKRATFYTLEAMFEDIFGILCRKHSGYAKVIKQKVSIGIEFYPDRDGDIINIDVVPGREFNIGQYENDHNLNLYVNSIYGSIAKQSHLKTNIKAQIEHIKSKDNERKVIRLLKIWKTSDKTNKDYKSFLLELITIKAFKKMYISNNRSLWEQLKAVMEYIRDHITEQGFKLEDPGNTGNNVADTLDFHQKHSLSKKMRDMLNRIGANPNYLKNYFPLNTKY